MYAMLFSVAIASNRTLMQDRPLDRHLWPCPVRRETHLPVCANCQHIVSMSKRLFVHLYLLIQFSIGAYLELARELTAISSRTKATTSNTSDRK